jgi:hypothetical protein
MATEGVGETMLTEKLEEAEWAAESLTWMVKGKDPATVGVPERVPEVLRARPLGREPLGRLQE